MENNGNHLKHDRLVDFFVLKYSDWNPTYNAVEKCGCHGFATTFVIVDLIGQSGAMGFSC